MCDAVSETPNTRIVIEGEAGIGKTTLVKRFCYLWACMKTKKKSTTPDDGCRELSAYSFIIPVFLRLVEHDTQLEDILHELCQDLTLPEVCAITDNWENHPDRILVLFDGFDEFSTDCKYINDVLSRNLSSSMLIFTTSRTYEVLQMKIRDLVFKLKGFSKMQIVKYFILFMEYYGKTEADARTLFDHLQYEHPNLLTLAEVPIRAEMIAIVWNKYGYLGATIYELYLMFIVHLLDHLESKMSEQDGQHLGKEQLLKKYGDLLSKVAQLANTRSGSGVLYNVFTREQIEAHLTKEEHQAVAKIGLLTKSHPSSQLDRALWSFPHLSIQEFMVAYHIGHATESDVEMFMTQCQKMKILRQSSVIFQFLVSKYPKTASQVLGKIIRITKDRDSCRSLYCFVLDLFPYFDKSIVLPMPRFVDFQWHNCLPEKWPRMDESVECQNLESLSLFIFDDTHVESVADILGQSYVKELDITVGLRKDENPPVTQTASKLHGSLRRMKSIKNLKIMLEETKYLMRTGCTEIQPEYLHLVNSILESIPAENLENLQLESNIDKKTIEILEKCPKLKELCIITTSFDFEVKNAFDNFTTLRMLSISVKQGRADLFCIQTPELSLDLHLKEKYLLEAVKYIKEMPNKCKVTQTKLGISSCKVSTGSCGELLGDLIVNMASLKYLVLKPSPAIQKKNLEAMLIKMSDRVVPLTQLNLGGNRLSGCGSEIGQMVNVLPALQDLSLSYCGLKASDLTAMAKKLSNNNNLKKLNLSSNKLGSVREGCEISHWQVLCGLPALYELSIAGCALTSSDFIAMAHQLPAANNLKVLNVSDNKVGSTRGGGYELLKKLPDLQHLQVENCNIEDSVPVICAACADGALRNLQELHIYWMPVERRVFSQYWLQTALDHLSLDQNSTDSIESDSTDLETNSSNEETSQFEVDVHQVVSQNLKRLAQHLIYMQKLQRLDIGDFPGLEKCTCKFLFENLEPTLEYLGLREPCNECLHAIIENKDRLRHLKQLHILICDDFYEGNFDLELLKDELKSLDIKVQVDFAESDDMWWEDALSIKNKSHLL